MKKSIPIRHLPSPPRCRRGLAALAALAIYTLSGLLMLSAAVLLYCIFR